MSSAFKARLFFALELILLFAIVFVVLIPIIPAGSGLASRDSGVFLYTGWRVLHGEIPYLQIWDHKPPIIYYLDAFGLWLTPNSALGVWWLEVFSLGLAGLAGYFLLKRLFGIFPAISITFLWLFSAAYLIAGGNLTTEYSLPLQFSLLFLFYQAENKTRYGRHGFFIGAITALLFFTRQNAVAIPTAIGFYLLLNRVIRRDFKRLFHDALVILIGGLVVSSIIVGYFAIKGALPAFWETAFLYNFAYTDEKGTADRINALIQGLNQLENLGLAQISFLGWGAAIALLSFKKERIRLESRPLLWMAIIAMPIELWMVSIGGRPRIPYFLVLLPTFAVFAGFVFWIVFDSLLKDIPRYAGALLVIVSVISLGLVFYADYSEMIQGLLKPSEGKEIISYIQENSSPNDFVLMWGAEASYNFATRRASPTRFVYQTPLYNEKNKAKVTEFLRGILNNKPQLIVVRAGDRLSDFRFGYRDNAIGGLMDQVKGLYGDSSRVGDWVVFHYSNQ